MTSYKLTFVTEGREETAFISPVSAEDVVIVQQRMARIARGVVHLQTCCEKSPSTLVIDMDRVVAVAITEIGP